MLHKVGEAVLPIPNKVLWGFVLTDKAYRKACYIDA